MLTGHPCRFTFVIVMGTVGTFAPARDPAPAARRDEQKKIEGRVEALARRLAAATDAMSYLRLTPGAEQKMLGDLAAALRDLSDGEIRQVLAHLDAAAKASDEPTAVKELLAARGDMRRIVSQLRAMAVRLDVVRNLDDAAAKLGRSAGKQLAIAAEAKQAVPPRGEKAPLIRPREHLAAEQADLNAEVNAVLKQLGEISRFLAPDEKDRLEKADAAARGKKLVAEMTLTLRAIEGDKFDDAVERQRRHAAELRDLAGALRGPDANRLLAVEAARAVLEAVLGSVSERGSATHAIDPKDRPSVMLLPETTREPGLKLESPNGKIDPGDFEWDMPLTASGRVMVIYHAKSASGISAVNIVYRVIQKGGRPAAGEGPHPRDDKDHTRFSRLPLREFRPQKALPGAFVPDLGLFETSKRFDAVEWFVLPESTVGKEAAVEAGGRVNFEVAGLTKKLPDGSTARLEVGDTVELYVEVFDNRKNRTAGYTRAKRKTVVGEYEARAAVVQQIANRKLADELRDLADDQVRVFVRKGL
jgi:hypothetical protein